MKLSLLKSAKYPDTSADMGEHDFTYALLPHAGTFLDGMVIEEANRLNLPALTVAGSTAKDSRRLVKVSTNAVLVDVVKKAEDEDCLVVRLHECHGSTVGFTLSSDFTWKKVESCNLLEEGLGETFEQQELTLIIFLFFCTSHLKYHLLLLFHRCRTAPQADRRPLSRFPRTELFHHHLLSDSLSEYP